MHLIFLSVSEIYRRESLKILFCLFDVHLEDRITEKEKGRGGGKERELPSISWFAPQMTATTRTVSVELWSQ